MRFWQIFVIVAAFVAMLYFLIVGPVWPAW